MEKGFHNIDTQSRNLFGWITALYRSAFHRPTLWVRLRNETALYPKMSRREIRRVTAAICKAALNGAK